MRMGQVIGTVTASVKESSLRGGRLLVVSPIDLEQLREISGSLDPEFSRISSAPSLIVWDQMGAGEGQLIGFVEGAEATAPFDHPIPLDALCIALLDQVHYHPQTIS